MTVYGHLVLGAAIGIVISQALGLDAAHNMPLVTGYAIGLLLPDIDEPGSFIGRRVIFVSRVLKDLGIGHRTITHNFFVSVMVMLIGYIAGSYGIFLMGLGFGMFIHTIGDLLTKGGIDAYFAPITHRTIRLLPKNLCFYTGSVGEYLFVATMSLYIAWMIYGQAKI